MLRVHPELTDERLLKLFEQGVERQWSSALLDWTEPETWDRVSLEALAALLTPVYLGEQTAMMGVSLVLPKLALAHDTEATLYLSSMGLDEARHFRNLSRLYNTLNVKPWATRQLPEMWRYHTRLMKSGDPIDWLWGILISDLFARLFYGRLRDQYPDRIIGRLARRTLVDEARHQAFADIYLSPRLVHMTAERQDALLALRDDLFRTMDQLTVRLEGPLQDLGWSGQAFLNELWADTEHWAVRLGIKTPVEEPDTVSAGPPRE
ncbi:MAG: ferritin-like domain-containing protein [Clostridia bacterium]